MAAQISQFSKCIQRKMIKSFSEQNGGTARCYQAIFVPSTAFAGPGYDGQPAVYLYIAALEVNVLNCRESVGGLWSLV